MKNALRISPGALCFDLAALVSRIFSDSPRFGQATRAEQNMIFVDGA